MAFSLSSLESVKQIKSETGETKRKEIAKCFVVIREQENITETIREALRTYLEARLKTTSNTNLSSELLKKNIEELLVFCTHKRYKAITLEDVISNESTILQHISWCTEYKNTKRLIFDEYQYH